MHLRIQIYSMSGLDSWSMTGFSHCDIWQLCFHQHPKFLKLYVSQITTSRKIPWKYPFPKFSKCVGVCGRKKMWMWNITLIETNLVVLNNLSLLFKVELLRCQTGKAWELSTSYWTWYSHWLLVKCIFPIWLVVVFGGCCMLLGYFGCNESTALNK